MADDEREEHDPKRVDADDESPREGIKGVTEAVRKALLGGFRSVMGADDGLRKVIAESFLVELLSYITKQVDVAKDEVVRVSGVQIRKFLENLDLGDELRKILTSISFEIKTEIRFIPNDQQLRPDARVRVKVKGGEGESRTRQAIKHGVKAAVETVLGALQRDERERDEADPPAEGDAGDDRESD